MCGIAGILNTSLAPVPGLRQKLAVTNTLLQHRGPDGEGLWSHARGHVGFAHRRLSIIDLSTGDQPMTDRHGNWVTYNGEIYNYVELREELGLENFRTTSDTEVILLAYRKWGDACVERFRGMFAFALWDEQRQRLFCARDRFGMKPFYYTLVGDTMFFASEVKALLPFMERIDTDLEGFKDYLTFQFCLQGKTLFRNVKELLPGHVLAVLAVNIQREVGGNLAEILDNVADTLRERATMRRQVLVLTAEGRLSAYVLVALPFGIGLYMAAVNPEYIGLLVTTTLGLVMLAGASVLIVAGVIWMRKIVNIDV
jgi:asparagine synthase (glutamine-hydrolysing)